MQIFPIEKSYIYRINSIANILEDTNFEEIDLSEPNQSRFTTNTSVLENNISKKIINLYENI
jgi:hypothetical protein